VLPPPPCFSCETPLLLPDGSYEKIRNLRIGDRVQTAHHGDVEILNITESPLTDLTRLVAVQPHACGLDQPFEEVRVTKNHAVYCASEVLKYTGPDAEPSEDLYIFPDRLNQKQVAPVEVHESSVCHVFVGSPDLQLVANGLPTESWDNLEYHDARASAWKTIADTSLVYRETIHQFHSVSEVEEFEDSMEDRMHTP